MEEEGACCGGSNNVGGIIGRVVERRASSENEALALAPVVDLTGQIHQLPCCIKHDGPSSVSHYFKPNKTGVQVEGGLNVEESFFRGRKLQGATIPIPQGYHGFVLAKKKNVGKRKSSGNSEENLNCWETRAGFQSMTYWNHDTLPSHDDVFLRCFHWFPIANALHKPVSADDLIATSTILEQS